MMVRTNKVREVNMVNMVAGLENVGRRAILFGLRISEAISRQCHVSQNENMPQSTIKELQLQPYLRHVLVHQHALLSLGHEAKEGHQVAVAHGRQHRRLRLRGGDGVHAVEE